MKIKGYAKKHALNIQFHSMIKQVEGLLFSSKKIDDLSAEQQKVYHTYKTLLTRIKEFAVPLGKLVKQYEAQKVPIAPKVSISFADHSFQLGISDLSTSIITRLQDANHLGAFSQKPVKDPFASFTGRWVGFWFGDSQKNLSYEIYDHHWQMSVFLEQEVFLQAVVMGMIEKDEIRQQLCSRVVEGCHSHFPEPALNALSLQTGVLLGAVGYKNGYITRPHIGYFLDPHTVFWVALESSNKKDMLYSFFMEHRKVPGDYTILGVQFIWNSLSKTFAFQRLMGGSYFSHAHFLERYLIL